MAMILLLVELLFTIVEVIGQDCLDNDLIVYTDDTCISLRSIPDFTTTYGSNVTYRCKSLLEYLPTSTFDYCPVELCVAPGEWTEGDISCAKSECYNVGASKNYQGTRTCTLSGIPCQAWDSQTPHTHLFTSTDFFEGDLFLAYKYCRDPAATYGQPWCFTSDSNVEWEYCEVQKCADLPIDLGDCAVTTSSPVSTTFPVTTTPQMETTSPVTTEPTTTIQLTENNGGQISTLHYLNIDQNLLNYAQIQPGQNIRTNLMCASRCDRHPFCKLYTYDQNNTTCSLYTFDMSGGNVICTGTTDCYLGQ